LNGLNGVKTKILRDKQESSDLNAINHRCRGLAEKICKTHAIVLAKLIKLKVRSEKELRLDLDERI
jgi:hypothetical protein